MSGDILSIGPEFLFFLSSAYGSGNLPFDVSVVGLILVAALSVVYFMRVAGLGRFASEREVELLGDVTELLNEMQVQIHELKTTLYQEFEQCRGELGYIRQEVNSKGFFEPVRHIETAKTRFDRTEGTSLRELFQ
jgi:hypothetical protein